MSWDCRVFTSEAIFQRYLLVGGLVFSVMSLPLFNEFCELRRVSWLRNIAAGNAWSPSRMGVLSQFGGTAALEDSVIWGLEIQEDI